MKNFLSKRQDIHFKLEKFDDDMVMGSINKLIYGVKAEKYYKQGSKKHMRIFFLLDDDYRYLQWISPQKAYTKSRIYLNDIKDISREIHRKIKNKNDQKFLRIQTQNYELILQFISERERDYFQCGLQHFLVKAQQHEYLEKRQDQVKHLANILFLNADKDGNKQLSLDEVRRLLQELHVSVNKKYLKQLFQTYDVNKNNQIDQAEFVNIIRDINKKEELQTVFKKYCSGYNQQLSLDQESLMTVQEYQKFMIEEQMQNISTLEIQEMFKNVNNISIMKGDSTKNQANLKISFYQFSNLIFSQENCIFDSKKEENYQNMDYPLSNYFINSSHNTYLMANQLTGESSCQAYINSFLKGCRCVELDCWDGEKNEPLVYHGHTLTSRILFKDVLETIDKYAFMMSPYPVILSFENHCSLEQTKKIAYYLKAIFKDKLYTVPKDYEKSSYYKSPNELKGKIIVKSKGKVEKAVSENPELGFQSDSEEEESTSKTDIQIIENNIMPDILNVCEQTPNKTQGKKKTIFMQKNREEQEEILNKIMSKQVLSPAVSRNQSMLKLDKDNGEAPKHQRGPSGFHTQMQKFNNQEDFHDIQQENKSFQKSLNQSDGQNLIRFDEECDELENDPAHLILRASKEQFSQKPQVISKPQFQVQKTLGDTNSVEDIPILTDQKIQQREQKKSVEIKVEQNISSSKKQNGEANKRLSIDKNQLSNNRIITNPDQLSESNIKEDGKKKKSKKNKPAKKVKECKELLEITSMFGCHMNIKEKDKQCWYISSINEVKYLKLLQKFPDVLLNMFKKSFVRLYPAGVRVDSSNYDPIKGFLSGSQVVALNFQTNDFPMLLNLSKFQENGGIHSGYVLKPDYMLHNTKKTLIPQQMTKVIKIVRIQVISGQQLRPEDYEQDTFDVVDPYIQIFIKGTDFDENNNKPYFTDVISDNGFHPIWNSELFEFKFACPELAMIVFRVMDSDVGVDTQLGIYATPVDCLRPGYRIIPLRSKSNLEFIDHSFILVKVSIEEKIQRYKNSI